MYGIISLCLKLQPFVQAGVNRLRYRGDRGVSALEYAALILVAALVVSLLWGVVNTDVKDNVSSAIADLFSPNEQGDGGDGGGGDEGDGGGGEGDGGN